VPGRRPGVAPLRSGTPGWGAPRPPDRGAAAADRGAHFVHRRAVEPAVAYTTLVPPLIVSGIGIGMIFATSASAATAAVPRHDTAVAAGTNTALRELGGVFGIAILAAVFAHNGSYASPAAFIDGFKPALWVAAVVPLVGLVAAFLAPSKAAAETEHTTFSVTHDALLKGQPE